MERLFATETLGGRALYRLHAATVAAGACLVLYYRATRVPPAGSGVGSGRAAWLRMLASELWYAVCSVAAQSLRWCPVRRRAFPDRLAARYGENLPCVDIFICTADPRSEPPSLVVSTALSVLAYGYPAEKLSVYLSDDGGSVLTFYALWEASRFAKHWLPFCRRYGVEPRSPAAYFSAPSDTPHAQCGTEEWSFVKELYEEMSERIDSVVMMGKVPEETKVNHKGFYEWDYSGITSIDHQPIVQVLIDGKDPNAVDSEGNVLPTLVYVAREKRPQHQHNFKAGAMNALIRVSSVISNGPLILNVDCDVYSSSSDTIREALCFFLDEEMGHKIAFVQYPQNFSNITRNNVYGFSVNVLNEVEMGGMDSVGGPAYIGTGCFHRRKVLCGSSFSKDYKEDWNGGMIVTAEAREHADDVEAKARSLARCDYEQSTQWGDEVGVKYGCPVEDIITGLAIQCRGWESVYVNPPRKAFVGLTPTTLAHALLQHRRWSEGNFSILLSRYCPFVFGHGKVKLRLQMGYSTYGLWAPSSLATLYYVVVPSLGLLNGVPLFPEITSPWIIPFVLVPAAAYAYSLHEALRCGDTLRGWWNGQRMWVMRRVTSYLFAMADTFLRCLLGLSAMAFAVTPKATGDGDDERSRRYEQGIMEFGPASSPELVIIAAVALLNLACLAGALSRVFLVGGGRWSASARAVGAWLGGMFPLQIALCGALVATSVPIYEAMFVRKDAGRLPLSATLVSIGVVLSAILVCSNGYLVELWEN